MSADYVRCMVCRRLAFIINRQLLPLGEGACRRASGHGDGRGLGVGRSASWLASAVVGDPR